MIQSLKRIVLAALFVGLFAVTALHAAPKKGRVKAASKTAYVIEELTVADNRAQGCFMRYQRRHDKAGYNKNVAFNMMCCDYSAEQSCCKNKGGENALGFERGCEPLLGARKPWLTTQEMSEINKRACEVADQCFVGGTAMMAGGALTFAGGLMAMSKGFMPQGTACVVAGGAVAVGGLKAVSTRHLELRECAKVADIKFKPNSFIKLQTGNIHDTTAMMRTLMTKTLFEEPHHKTGSLQERAEQGAHNLEVMATPEREAVEDMIQKNAETTGGIIPNTQK